MKIWNSQKAQDFRKQLVKERVGICKKCGVDESAIFSGMSWLLKIPLLRRLSRRDKPVAVLVSVADAELPDKSEDAADIQDAKKALAEYHRNPASAEPFKAVLKNTRRKV